MTAEARQLRADRQLAVRQAWKAEAELVRHGMGTRNWTTEEQNELLTRGSVKGYEGHHMVSVANNRALASDPNNIQFLTRDEHINGAHQGDPHNLTNGYYNPNTKTMEPFPGNEVQPVPAVQLTDPVQSGQGQGAENGSAPANTVSDTPTEASGPGATSEASGPGATSEASGPGAAPAATDPGQQDGPDDSQGQER